MMKAIYLRITLIKQINIFIACAIVWASIPANADASLLKMYLCPNELPETIVNCFHLPDVSEELDFRDSDFMELPSGEYEFYSNNPLAASGSGPKKATDARPVGSYSTWTCYIDGYNLPAEGVSSNIVIKNHLASSQYDTNFEGNNVIVDVFENNAPEGSDPNYVHIGRLDAVQATKVYPEAVFNLTVKPGYHTHAIIVKHFKPGDVNFSGNVDYYDFLVVSSNWNKYFGADVRTAYSPLENPEFYTDIDKDGSVGLSDLAILTEDWLFQKPVYEIDQYNPDIPIS